MDHPQLDSRSSCISKFKNSESSNAERAFGISHAGGPRFWKQVQQQMQSQIIDLRDKLTDAYSEIANMKKSTIR